MTQQHPEVSKHKPEAKRERVFPARPPGARKDYLRVEPWERRRAEYLASNKWIKEVKLP